MFYPKEQLEANGLSYGRKIEFDFPYRTDAIALWDVIAKYVQSYLDVYYSGEELQKSSLDSHTVPPQQPVPNTTSRHESKNAMGDSDTGRVRITEDQGLCKWVTYLKNCFKYDTHIAKGVNKRSIVYVITSYIWTVIGFSGQTSLSPDLLRVPSAFSLSIRKSNDLEGMMPKKQCLWSALTLGAMTHVSTIDLLQPIQHFMLDRFAEKCSTTFMKDLKFLEENIQKRNRSRAIPNNSFLPSHMKLSMYH